MKVMPLYQEECQLTVKKDNQLLMSKINYKRKASNLPQEK